MQGVAPTREFEKLLPRLKRESPDLLIVTGDLAADEPEPAGYEYLKECLDSLGFPWLVIKGNHDRGSLFDEVFEKHFMSGFRCRWDSGIPLLFFDTSSEALPHNELNALEEFLSNSSQPSYLFTHYPPVTVGHPLFDDIHYLPWKEELFDVLSRSPQPVHVFFGHIHFSFQSTFEQAHFYSIPSATLPILPDQSDFVLDPNGPYYRKVLVTPTHCETSVHSIKD